MVSGASPPVKEGTPGLSLATLDAPYLAYLNACTSEYRLGEFLREALKKRIKLVAHGNGQVRGTSQGDNVAQIVDLVSSDRKGLRVGEYVCLEHLRRAYRGELAGQVFVEQFLKGMRECKNDVQTRLILLQVYDTNEENKALVDLLFAHLAGVELGMRPQQVDMIAQLGTFDSHDTLLRYPIQPDLLYLGDLETDDLHCMGFHLGRRKVGAGEPSLGMSPVTMSRMGITNRL